MLERAYQGAAKGLAVGDIGADGTAIGAALERVGVPDWLLGAPGDELADTVALSAAFGTATANLRDALVAALLPAGTGLLSAAKTGHDGPGHSTTSVTLVALSRAPCPDWVLVRPCSCGDNVILAVGDTKRGAANNATGAKWADQYVRIPGTRWTADLLPNPPGTRQRHRAEPDGTCLHDCEVYKPLKGGLHIPSFYGQNDFYRAFDWATPQALGLRWPPAAVVDDVVFMVLHEDKNTFAESQNTYTASEWLGTSYMTFLRKLVRILSELHDGGRGQPDSGRSAELAALGRLTRTLQAERLPGGAFELSGPGLAEPRQFCKSLTRALDELWYARDRADGGKYACATQLPWAELRHRREPRVVVTLSAAGQPVLHHASGGVLAAPVRQNWEELIVGAGWNVPGQPCLFCHGSRRVHLRTCRPLRLRSTRGYRGPALPRVNASTLRSFTASLPHVRSTRNRSGRSILSDLPPIGACIAHRKSMPCPAGTVLSYPCVGVGHLLSERRGSSGGVPPRSAGKQFGAGTPRACIAQLCRPSASQSCVHRSESSEQRGDRNDRRVARPPPPLPGCAFLQGDHLHSGAGAVGCGPGGRVAPVDPAPKGGGGPR